MQITETRLKAPENGEKRVLAYATVILDNMLAIHDIRLVVGLNGYFVAMPDKEIWVPCPTCKKKSPHRARFCMHCGLECNPAEKQAKRFVDVVHPISMPLRTMIEQAVIAAYKRPD